MNAAKKIMWGVITLMIIIELACVQWVIKEPLLMIVIAVLDLNLVYVLFRIYLEDYHDKLEREYEDESL